VARLRRIVSLLPILNALCFAESPGEPESPCSWSIQRNGQSLRSDSKLYVPQRRKLFGYYATGGEGGTIGGRTEELYCPSSTAYASQHGPGGDTCARKDLSYWALRHKFWRGEWGGGVLHTVGQASGFKFYIEARYIISPQGVEFHATCFRLR